jgi:hypothetical protein
MEKGKKHPWFSKQYQLDMTRDEVGIGMMWGREAQS